MMTPTSTHYIVVTDIQRAENAKRAAQAPAERAIAVAGSILESADRFVAELESNELLGSAIVRSCRDLADLIGNLAAEVEQQQQVAEDGESAVVAVMAKACFQDMQQQQQQQETSAHHEQQHLTTTKHFSEQDILSALSGAQALLRDVESSLRSISNDEADEIADVALTVARLTILSLKDVHSTLTPDQLMKLPSSSASYLEASDRIELLDEDDDKQDDETASAADKKRSAKATGVRTMRVLWPPLGPAVVSAAQWGKEEAVKRPLLAVALGLTLWPAAVVTALLGAPVVLADSLFLQDCYDAGGPLVETLERGAAQVYHAGRLAFLCSGLVARQSLRVAKRQVERHGGAEAIAREVGHAVLDRIAHPVQTAGMAWQGIRAGAAGLLGGIQFLQEAVERHQELQKAEIIR